MTFQGEVPEIADGELSENDVLVMFFGKKQTPETTALARVKTIQVRGSDASVTCSFYLVSRPDFKANFRPNSKWTGQKIFSLTTAIREYEVLTKVSKLNLHREIFQPSLIKKPAISPEKVSDAANCFKVNIPQAEAIIAASSQSSGFVLIQGPPGTGKTKTILGIMGAQVVKPSLINVPGAMNNHGSQTVISKKKVLCCAPSNAAVDEIARRVMCGLLDRRGRHFKPKVVRLGTSAVHSSVKPVTLVRAQISI